MSGSLARTVYLAAGSSGQPPGYWWPTKEPDGVLDYNANAYRPLADVGELDILTASIAIQPSGSGELAINSLNVAGSVLTAVLSSGVAGRSYLAKLEFTTADCQFEFLINLSLDCTLGTCPPPAPPSTGFGTPVTWTA